VDEQACLLQRGQTTPLSENAQETGVAGTSELFVVVSKLAANVQQESESG